MKHRFLSAALCAAFAATAVFALVSCDEETVYYTVTAEYDETQGEVTVTEPAHADGYTAGETVKVTVTPKENFETAEVTVNGTAAPDLSTFHFTVGGNTVIGAVFTEKTPAPGGETEERYTVTLTVNAPERGEATLSAPKDGNDEGKYAPGEEVTLTLSPHAGSSVKGVVVNRKQVFPEGNAYSFKVEEDTDITVTFMRDDSTLPDLSGMIDGFDEIWTGEWSSADGAHSMYIAESCMSIDDNAVTLAAVSSSTAGEGYDITAGGRRYIIEWAEDLYTANYVICLFENSTQEKTYFVRTEDLSSTVTVEEKYRGTWYLGEEASLEISEHSITVFGKRAEAVIDGGYYEESNDGYHADIGAHIYFLIADGDYYRLSWYPTGGVPVIGDDYFTRNPVSDIVTPDPAMIGTWEGVGEESRTLTVTDGKILIDGAEAKLVRGDGAVGVNIGGTTYFLLSFDEFAIFFRTYTYDEMGLITGFEDVAYFARADRDKNITLPDYMEGTWRSDEGDLTVGDGVRWGALEGEILGRSELGGDGGGAAGASAGVAPCAAPAPGETMYSYTVAFGNIVYTLAYEADAETLVLTGNDGMVTFIGEGIPTAFRGRWQTDGETGKELVIREETLTFGGSAYSVSFSEGKLTFTDGESVRHALAVTEEYGGLILSDTNPVSGAVEYYLNADGVYPAVPMDGSMFGRWKDATYELELDPALLTLNGKQGTFLQYDEASLFYIFFSDGKLYNLQQDASSLSQLFLWESGQDLGDDGQTAVTKHTLTKAVAPTPVSLPEAYRGTKWTTETGSFAEINANGALFLGGQSYSVYAEDDHYTLTLGGQEATLFLGDTLILRSEGNETVYYRKTELDAALYGRYTTADESLIIGIGADKITITEPEISRDVYVFTFDGTVKFGENTISFSFGNVLLTYTPFEGEEQLLLREGYDEKQAPAALYGEYEADGTDHVKIGEDGVAWGTREVKLFGVEEVGVDYTLGLVVDGEIVFLEGSNEGFTLSGYSFTLYEATATAFTVTAEYDTACGVLSINGTPYTEPVEVQAGQITIKVEAGDGLLLFEGTVDDGTVHTLLAGEQTVNINGNATIRLTFTAKLPAEYEGTFRHGTSSGVVGSSVIIEGSIFTLSSGGDVSYPLKKADGGYTYLVEDVEYTVSLLGQAENAVLCISTGEGADIQRSLYLREDAVQIYAEGDLCGTGWHSAEGPLSVSSSGAVTFSQEAAFILKKDGNGYVLLVGGDLFSLTYVFTADEKSLTLTSLTNENVITFAYEPPPTPSKLPSEFFGEWKCDEHTVVVGSDGSMQLDGTTYDVYSVGGSKTLYSFTAPYNGEERTWQIEYYNETSMGLGIGYDAYWKLIKDIPLSDWNWGDDAALNALKEYSGVFTTSASNVPDLIICQNGRVSWGEERFIVKYENGAFKFVGNKGTSFQFSYDGDSYSLTKDGFTVDRDGNTYKFTRSKDAPADYTGN